MKKQKIILIVFFILTIAGCTSSHIDGFTIYLLSQDMSALDASKMDVDQLPLEIEPLLSGEDIVSYELANHIIEITPAAYRRFRGTFPQLVRVAGIPFVVCAGSQRIYAGALWTPASSISYDGVIILQPFDNDGTTIQLSLGYPGPDSFTGSDPRADPRIVRALEQAEKLKPISE
jgi:hypothetical protein